ncbi:MAG: hypothetical protein HY361_04060 [Candidatus Aenigmarchaeota archaeon]|nr:hypothetical protein [Candidatus Aenigmarchaeota archaeon]
MTLAHVFSPYNLSRRYDRTYTFRLIKEKAVYLVPPEEVDRIILPPILGFYDTDFAIIFSPEGYTEFLNRLDKHGKRIVG